MSSYNPLVEFFAIKQLTILNNKLTISNLVLVDLKA